MQTPWTAGRIYGEKRKKAYVCTILRAPFAFRGSGGGRGSVQKGGFGKEFSSAPTNQRKKSPFITTESFRENRKREGHPREKDMGMTPTETGTLKFHSRDQ